jgi:hypothetical protein
MEMTGPFGRIADRYQSLPVKTIGARPFKTTLGSNAQSSEQQDLEVDFPLQTNLRLSKRKNEEPHEYDRITERHAGLTHRDLRSPDICQSLLATHGRSNLTFVPAYAKREASTSFEDCCVHRTDCSTNIINTFSSRSEYSGVLADKDIQGRNTAIKSPPHTSADSSTGLQPYGEAVTIRTERKAGRKADCPKHTISSINSNGWHQDGLALSTRPAEPPSILQNTPSVTEKFRPGDEATTCCISSAKNLTQILNTEAGRTPTFDKAASVQERNNVTAQNGRRTTIDAGTDNSFFQTVNRADQFKSRLSATYSASELSDSIYLANASSQPETVSAHSRRNECAALPARPNAQKQDSTGAIESIPEKYGKMSGSDFKNFQPEFAALITSVKPEQALPDKPELLSTYDRNQSDKFETTVRSNPEKEVRKRPVLQQATEPGLSTRGNYSNLVDYPGISPIKPLSTKMENITRKEPAPTRTFTDLSAEPYEPATTRPYASLSPFATELGAFKLSRSADSTGDRQSGNNDDIHMPGARQPSAAIEATKSLLYPTLLQSHLTPELPKRAESGYATDAAQDNLPTVSLHNETVSSFKSPEMTLPSFDKKERASSGTLSTPNNLHGLNQSGRKSSQNDMSSGHNGAVNQWAGENQLQTGQPGLWAAEQSSILTGRNAANRNDNPNSDSFVPEEDQNKTYNRVLDNPDLSDVEILTEKVYERIMRTIEQEFERGW